MRFTCHFSSRGVVCKVTVLIPYKRLCVIHLVQLVESDGVAVALFKEEKIFFLYVSYCCTISHAGKFLLLWIFTCYLIAI